MNYEAVEFTELLLLPDGRILAHNITPQMAAVLSELDPQNESLRERAQAPAARLRRPLVESETCKKPS